jgi:outer membrane protein assembly factor BamE (lipoprotein component of BamABCDE complex)
MVVAGGRTKGISGPARKNAGSAALARLPAFVLCLIFGLAACSPVYRNHGYAPSDRDLALIEVGSDTRETVAEKVGRPSASGLLNDVGWFYVQSRWKDYGARPSEEIDRQVVSITFTESGTVANVERFGMERGRIVPLSRRVTDSNIKGVSFLRQLLGSIGKLRADAPPGG